MRASKTEQKKISDSRSKQSEPRRKNKGGDRKKGPPEERAKAKPSQQRKKEGNKGSSRGEGNKGSSREEKRPSRISKGKGAIKRNTESFEPNYDAPDVRVVVALPTAKLNRPYSVHDIVMVPQLACEQADMSMYDELVKMVRIHLRMPETQVSDRQLQEVWRALDQDNSGYINAGEFGRFMRLGRERCAQCIAERLPGVAQALVREDPRVSIGVDAAEEARRYSISHTVAGPARCCPPSPHHPRPHVTLLTHPPHTLRTHPPHTLHAPSSHH